MNEMNSNEKINNAATTESEGCNIWVDLEKRQIWFMKRKGAKRLHRNSTYSCALAVHTFLTNGFQLMLAEDMPMRQSDLTAVFQMVYNDM